MEARRPKSGGDLGRSATRSRFGEIMNRRPIFSGTDAIFGGRSFAFLYAWFAFLGALQ